MITFPDENLKNASSRPNIWISEYINPSHKLPTKCFTIWSHKKRFLTIKFSDRRLCAPTFCEKFGQVGRTCVFHTKDAVPFQNDGIRPFSNKSVNSIQCFGLRELSQLYFGDFPCRTSLETSVRPKYKRFCLLCGGLGTAGIVKILGMIKKGKIRMMDFKVFSCPTECFFGQDCLLF